MKKLSIIIPAYNESDNIENTADVIGGIMIKAGISGEIVFVDDGSKDESWAIIDRLSRAPAKTAGDALEADRTVSASALEAASAGVKVRGIKFSRNFGKEGAIFAGLKAVKGDAAILIDCDLQHPPELIPKMYALWREGNAVVEAVKSSRGKEGLLYKFFAKSFYRTLKSSANIDLDGASDYKLLDRKVINAINSMPERLTFFRALSGWVGFNVAQIEFDVAPRAAGETKWNFRKLFIFALNSITGFTSLPMHIITGCGVVFMLGTAAMVVHTLVNYFTGHAATGFTTVILLLLIIGGLLMLGLGVIGFYLGKIYEEIKFRPRYVIDIDTDDIGDDAENIANPVNENPKII